MKNSLIINKILQAARAVLPCCLAICALSGCATAYQKLGATGGYTEKEAQPGVWAIKFQGNGNTTEDETKDYARLRATEIAVMKKLPYLTILNENTVVTHEEYIGPTGVIMPTFTPGANGGTWGAASVNGPMTGPGKPTTSLEVRLDREQIWLKSFNAKTLQNEILSRRKATVTHPAQ